jgi:hypothetical protein
MVAFVGPPLRGNVSYAYGRLRQRQSYLGLLSLQHCSSDFRTV